MAQKEIKQNLTDMVKKSDIDEKSYGVLLKDAQHIIETSRQQAYSSINVWLVWRNWNLGKRIKEENLHGEKRAEYGAQVIVRLADDLTKIYGKGFDFSSLYKYVKFYNFFPGILDSVSPKSNKLLSWTHYRTLLQVDDAGARQWYAKEAFEQTWGVRTLQRNISTQYYYRLLQSQKKDLVEKEMLEKTAPLQQDKLEFIKNPVVTEFLGLSQNTDFRESTLENAIISNMEKFLLELGKGFAFVKRQYHIHTEKEDYYIDLVFYNYLMRCFVLIDLKTTKVTHQDIGQMDMYVRMFDELRRSKSNILPATGRKKTMTTAWSHNDKTVKK